MTTLPSPHGTQPSPHGTQSRPPMYTSGGGGSGRASPQQLEQDRSRPARSYIEYPSDLRSDNVSDGLPRSPEAQLRSSRDSDERYHHQERSSSHFQNVPQQGILRQVDTDDRIAGFQGAAGEMSPGVHESDRPQSPLIGYSGSIPVRHDKDATTRSAANVEYGMIPPSSQADDNMNVVVQQQPQSVARLPQSTDIVRDLPPLPPSARGGARHRSSSDTNVRGGGTASSRFGHLGSEVPPPPGNYSRKVLQDIIQV